MYYIYSDLCTQHTSPYTHVPTKNTRTHTQNTHIHTIAYKVNSQTHIYANSSFSYSPICACVKCIVLYVNNDSNDGMVHGGCAAMLCDPSTNLVEWSISMKKEN